MKILDKELLQN